eukprot:jgi/Psemu1/13220/gm1.13220_g
MGDFFANKLWEEEPDFARDDNNEQGENADRDNEDNENQYGAHHVIALVDCHPDMFEKGESRIRVDETDDNIPKGAPAPAPVELSIKLVQTLLQLTIEQTVIRKTGKRNGVGLLLYNTKMVCDKISPLDETNDDDDDDDDDDDKMDDEDDDEDHSVTEQDGLSTPTAETTVHRLLDLEPPGIKHAQTLRTLLPDDHRQTTANRDLQAEFRPSERDLDVPIAPLQTALEEAMRMFLNAKCVRDPKHAKSKNEYDSRSIWVFTNQANPYSDEKKQLIENIANLAKEQRIKIVVWPLEHPFYHQDNDNNNNNNNDDGDQNDEFDSAFFKSIASEFASEHCQRFRSEIDMQDELAAKIGTMNQKRRFFDHDRLVFRCSVVKEAWESTNRQGDKKTIKVRLTLEKDTGRDVARFWTKPTPEQRSHQRSQPGMRRFRHFFKFANELVPITQQDMRIMKENANGGYAPGLTILGFKPRSVIPFYHSISKTFVIFPNDTDVKGSRNAFYHLHAAMLRKNVLGVGEVLHTRESSQSRLVAIYPFESTDYLPAGMHVTTLPFEDDMRAVVPDAASIEWNLSHERKTRQLNGNKFSDQKEPDFVGSNGKDGFSESNNQEPMLGSIASEDLVDAAIKLMSCQSLKSMEIGTDFDNAALTEFYSYLKSVAFNTAKEELIYDTIQDAQFVLEIAGKEIDAFKSILPIDVKRQEAAPSRKRVRNIVPDKSGIDWKELYRTNEVGSCKMDLLKQYLRSVGLPTSGRKSDLVDRVIDSLETKRTKDKMECTTNDRCSIKEEEELKMGLI